MENILFGAEFDSGSLNKGAEGIVSALKTVEVSQQKVQAAFDVTAQKMEQVDAQIKETTAQFNSLDKASKDYATSSVALKEKIDSLNKENTALTTSMKAQKDEFDKLKTTNDNLGKSLKDIEAQQKRVQEVFGKKISPNVDINSLNAANTKLAQLKANFEKAFTPGTINNLFDPKQIDLLLSHVAQGKGEFEQFTKVVEALSASLETVEPGTEAFNDLSAAIRAGKQVVQEYTKLYVEATTVVEESETPYRSIRQRLVELRNELTKLEEAGQEETAQYRETQIAAARLTDQYGDMQQQIRILASDTKYLDFGVDAIQAGAAGLQVYAGALALVGVSTQDAEEIQTKLLAIMSLVQGMQQLQNLLLKESVIRTVGATIATNVYAASQGLLAAAFGTTVAASKAANAALISTGIGALIVAIGYLIYKIKEWNDATDDAVKANERFGESLKRNTEYMKEDLDAIDANMASRAEKIKQQGNNETLLYDNSQTNYREKVIFYNEQLLALQRKFDDIALQETQTTNATELKLLAESRAKVVAEQLRLISEVQKIKADNILAQEKENTRLADEEEKRQKRLRDIATENALRANADFDERKDLISLKANFETQIRELNRQGIETATTEALYAVKRGEIVDRYNKLRAEKERELRKEIASITDVEEKKDLINLKFEHENKLKELRRIDANTASEVELYEKRVEAVRTKWRRARADEERKLEKEVLDIRFEAQEAHIANITNEFERERNAINEQANKSKEDLQARQTEMLNGLLDDMRTGMITPQQYSDYVSQVNLVFDKLFDELGDKTTADLHALGNKILQGTVTGINDSLHILSNSLTIEASREIAGASKLFTSGKITYEAYEKELTRISFEESQRRLQNTKNAIMAEITLVQQRLKGNIDENERKALDTQLSDLNAAYADADKEQTEGQAANTKKQKDGKLKALTDILSAYQSLAQSIVGFLNIINDAEQARLDRSISLQQKRVDNARQLAEKGNAEYLELEQKRLDELTRKREANARKQMAINNALTASQALVAAISAVANASEVGGIVAGIAAGAAVIAAIASLYQFVSTLQAPEAQFYEGTTFVEGEPGRDKVKARLTRGEAVIPVDRNAAYNDTVKAIYNKTIPADVLNYFVNSYPSIELPVLDYSRVDNATGKHFEGKAQVETNRRLEQVNDTLFMVVEKLDNLDNVSMSFDENGFAVSLIRAMRNERMKWKN